MTILRLGQVTFANNEIPERINFGGDQSLSVKQLVGGQRIVDAMGRVDDDISWSGLFFGSTATFRARFLDTMRTQGAKIPLTWSQFSFLVVIKSFKPSFERTYQIPYSITCTVVQDLTKPFPFLLPVGYNDAILNQITAANDLASLINNPSVSNAMTALNAAINAIPDFNIASDSQIATVLSPLITAQATVNTAISALSLTTFGGS